MTDARGMPLGRLAFALLWFCATYWLVMLVARTSSAANPASPDFFFLWLLMACGVVICTAGFAAIWAFVLMDARWTYPPGTPNRRGSVRARLARG